MRTRPSVPEQTPAFGSVPAKDRQWILLGSGFSPRFRKVPWAGIMCGGRVESRGQEVDPLPEVHKVEGARLFVPDARDPSRTMDAAVVSFVPKDP